MRIDPITVPNSKMKYRRDSSDLGVLDYRERRGEENGGRERPRNATP
jgi:hypothetical protein